MSKLNLCKGDLICRYWMEFAVFIAFVSGSFGLGIAIL